MDFDHLVFEKVCFNLIKLSLFCFIFSFFSLGLGLELGGKGTIFLGTIVLEPFLPVEKRGFFTCQRDVRFYLFIICAKLHIFVDTK